MKIPLVDLYAENKAFEKKFSSEIKELIKTGDFVLGDAVSKFEEEFASYLNVKYCIGVASGTDAILLSLLSLEIKADDEVIVPAFTFSATISPILHVGAIPILIDSYSDNPNMNLEEVENAITQKTKAIIVVHMYGMPNDMSRIKQIATRYNLKVIEDACQAHGSEIYGKKMGNFGDTAAFSFYPSKNLGAFGDAGAVVTNDKNIADKIKMLRNHGQEKKYLHSAIGINSRLDTIQAIILRLKLQKLDVMNTKRRIIASKYQELLSGLPLEIISKDEVGKTNYHLFVIKTKKRDALLNFLNTKDIQCGIHYPYPIHQNPAFAGLIKKTNNLENADKLSSECLSLPLFPELTFRQIKTITEFISYFYEK